MSSSLPKAVAVGNEVPVTYEPLADDVHVGDRLLINDGLIELVVLEGRGTSGLGSRAARRNAGESTKGINLPGVQVSAPSITEKDREDILFAVDQEVEYLALSFVRRAQDIAELRALIPKGLLVIAKIEKDSALENIESIASASDGIMVARGDLGVELPFEEVPYAQKRIIALCNRLGRPVITATQMLESMVTHPRPTRAEASDLSPTRFLDGTDAVMLSAETATGQLSAACGRSDDAHHRRGRGASAHYAARRAPERRGRGLDGVCDCRRQSCRRRHVERAVHHCLHQEWL